MIGKDKCTCEGVRKERFACKNWGGRLHERLSRKEGHTQQGVRERADVHISVLGKGQ